MQGINNIVSTNRPATVSRVEILKILVRGHKMALPQALDIVRKYEDAGQLHILDDLLF